MSNLEAPVRDTNRRLRFHGDWKADVMLQSSTFTKPSHLLLAARCDSALLLVTGESGGRLQPLIGCIGFNAAVHARPAFRAKGLLLRK